MPWLFDIFTSNRFCANIFMYLCFEGISFFLELKKNNSAISYFDNSLILSAQITC